MFTKNKHRKIFTGFSIFTLLLAQAFSAIGVMSLPQVASAQSGPAPSICGFSKVAAAEQHELFLKNDGTVWAEGDNTYGELGIANNTSNYTAQQEVVGTSGSGHLSTITQVAANGGSSNADEYSMALGSDGQVYTWGANNFGQLGNGTNTNSNFPVQVSGVSNVTAIAAGENFAVALESNGTVWTWGLGGDLGNGLSSSSNVPVEVLDGQILDAATALSGVTAVSAGQGAGYALRNDGTVWAWGDNTFGELGDGTTSSSLTANPVSNLTGITSISGGFVYAAAVDGNHNVWTWGRNTYGALGDGTTTDRHTPVEVVKSGGGFLSNITAVSMATQHYFGYALDSSGQLWAWGTNFSGQLGVAANSGTNNPTTVPVAVGGGLNNIQSFAGGWDQGYAVENNNTLFQWGNSVSTPAAFACLTPNVGPVAGGTSVTITGTNFASLINGMAVTFGGQSATVTSVPDSHTMIATTPPGSAGAVDVIPSDNFGTGVADPGAFTYQSTPPPGAPSLTVWSEIPNMFLQWSPADSNATSFKIFYGPTSGFPGNAQELDTNPTDTANDYTTITQYNSAAFTIGTQYSFYIEEVAPAGTSPASTTIAKTIFTPPTLDNSVGINGIIGSAGSGNGQFSYMEGNIVTDSTTGEIYVPDSRNTRIEIFDASGNYLTQIKSAQLNSGTYNFVDPEGIAIWVDPNTHTKYLYVGDNDYNNNVYSVIKFVETDSGTLTPSNPPTFSNAVQWDGSVSGSAFQWVNSLAIDNSNGNIYVADWGNRVVELGSSGNFIRQISQWSDVNNAGSNSGNIFRCGPSGVAIDSNHQLYVADWCGSQIFKFDESGSNNSYVTKWGSSGSGDGQFSSPEQIAIDPSGNVYVTNDSNNRIDEYTNSGTLIRDWGFYNSNITDTNDGHQMNYPEAIGIDSSANIYVGDTDNNRVEVYGAVSGGGGGGGNCTTPGPNNQCLTLPINCNSNPPATTFSVPANVTFNPATAGADSDIFDQAVTSASGATSGAIPSLNLLEVTVGNSGGSGSCPTTNAGFVITAASTDLTSGSNSILAGGIRMVTTSNVTGASNLSPALTADGNVLYSDASAPGNLHDVLAPLSVSSSADLTNATNYNLSSVTDNTFKNNQQLTVLQTCTGHGVSASPYTTDIAVGVGLTTHVLSTTPVGSYSGTVTFTEIPIDCSPVSGVTLSSDLIADSNTMYVSSATGLSVNEVILVDAEKMQITAISENRLTVNRAVDGTIVSAHSSGTAVYSVQ